MNISLYLSKKLKNAFCFNPNNDPMNEVTLLRWKCLSSYFKSQMM